jgi:hypothetical protein
LAGFGSNHLWTVRPGDPGDSCICHSTDAGATWSCVPNAPETPYDSYSKLFFIDERHGWRYGGASNESLYGFIQHTTDGGATWVHQLNFEESSFDALSFVDSLHGWTSCYFGEIFKTTDGGDHWTQLPSLSVSGNCIQFLDTLNGWATPYLHTTDGGNTWETIRTGCHQGISNMYFRDANHGWAVGWYGTVLGYNSAISAAKPHAAPIPVRLSLAAYPNPFNPNTMLSFDVPHSGRLTISIYDLTGRLVRMLADRVYPEGNFRINFDGSALPSGIYFARLQGKSFSKTQKLVLLK